MSTDTACSSSLVATHLAHKGLLMEESNLAVAAGSNAMLLAGTTAAICQLQALSPVGRCKTFDSSGDGYGRGEGFAALVMRRAALVGGLPSNGTSYAVVRGSTINQGGRSSGLTAPNGPAQTALVKAALASGALPASQLGLVSIHGTGVSHAAAPEPSVAPAVHPACCGAYFLLLLPARASHLSRNRCIASPMHLSIFSLSPCRHPSGRPH